MLSPFNESKEIHPGVLADTTHERVRRGTANTQGVRMTLRLVYNNGVLALRSGLQRTRRGGLVREVEETG